MWCFNTFIIILLAFISGRTSEGLNKIVITNIENKTKNDKVSESIAQMTKEHISCKSTVFIVSSSNHEDLLLRSINEHYCFAIITRHFAVEEYLVIPDAYLISANNATDFLKGLRELSEDLFWNPRAYFLIYFRNRVNEVTEIFEELMTLMIFKVVLLRNIKNDDLEALTYNMHDGKYCSRNASNIRSLGYYPKFSETLFPDKIQNDFSNCTIMVVIKEEVPFVLYNNTEYVKYLKTGVEQYLLQIVAQKIGIHFKYNFISPDNDFGVLLPNGTATGLLGYLQRHEANIAAGGLLLLKSRLEVFDYVYGYGFAIFSVFTPTLPEERWSRVYKQFSVSTWFLIILSFVFTLLVILLTKALTTRKSEDELLMILKLWRYFYGQADVTLFKDSYIQRFLIVWIVFTSSIYAFYNTASYSLITGHVQDKIKINHKNLAALPFKPCITDFTRYYFMSAYNESFPKNDVERDSECLNTDMAFHKVATSTNLYTVDTDYTYYLRAIKYLDSEGQLTINKWDYPRTDTMSIYLTKGYPLRDIIQQYALRVYETGLLKRHLSNIYTRKPKTLPTLKRKYKVIRLEDFKIHYCVLLIGCLISFICLIIECNTGI